MLAKFDDLYWLDSPNTVGHNNILVGGHLIVFDIGTRERFLQRSHRLKEIDDSKSNFFSDNMMIFQLFVSNILHDRNVK